MGSEIITTLLQVCGVSCASLHSDKPQQMRTQILQDFQNGSYQALVSTSILGRGIDLLNVVMVIIGRYFLTIDEILLAIIMLPSIFTLWGVFNTGLAVAFEFEIGCNTWAWLHHVKLYES